MYMTCWDSSNHLKRTILTWKHGLKMLRTEAGAPTYTLPTSLRRPKLKISSASWLVWSHTFRIVFRLSNSSLHMMPFIAFYHLLHFTIKGHVGLYKLSDPKDCILTRSWKSLICYTNMNQRERMVWNMINEQHTSCVFFSDTSFFPMKVQIDGLLGTVLKSFNLSILMPRNSK